MKRKDPATKNQKYLAIFLAITMFLSAFMIYFTADSKTDSDSDVSPSENGEENPTISFSQIPGKKIHHEFNSIADGLNMTPEGALIARYIDLQKATGTPFEQVFGNATMMSSFYGADVTKSYGASYADGSGFELHQIPEQKILMPWGAVPYDGYNLLARTNNTYDIWNVAGNPVILGSRQNVKDILTCWKEMRLLQPI